LSHGATTGSPPPSKLINTFVVVFSGVLNYFNDILIDIVKQQLLQGAEAWRTVALLYQNASNERDLCRGEDICDNWVRKLCNNY
jgi:hypothetical protein